MLHNFYWTKDILKNATLECIKKVGKTNISLNISQTKKNGMDIAARFLSAYIGLPKNIKFTTQLFAKI